MTKSAIVTGDSMLNQLFAVRLASDNIGVFKVSLGVIDTPMSEKSGVNTINWQWAEQFRKSALAQHKRLQMQ